MEEQEFLKLLKDKKVADAYQYYDSSSYKLIHARISYEALEKVVNDFFEMGKESIQKVFKDAGEMWRGEYKVRSETVNFCGIEIGISTAMNKLTMEILSLLHNFFDVYAQWINASMLGENSLDIGEVSLKSVAKEITKYSEYRSQFVTDFCDIINRPEYSYVADFNNTLKHRSQLYVENSINVFTSEGSVAIPEFEKDGRSYSKEEVLDIIKKSLEYCEKQLYDSRKFIENYYLQNDCLYTSHRLYNPKFYLHFANESDYKNQKPPIQYYYFIEVDPMNILKEYHVMLAHDGVSSGGRIKIYNSPYPVIVLRGKNGNKIVGIMKPDDGEVYTTKDAHSLCYRKYKVQTNDYEQEMLEAKHNETDYYMPFLSEVIISYDMKE